jgi:predicted SAM-dependent methyltransferase
MRIAMPDLESIVELYRRRDWDEHAKLCGKFGLEYVKTPAELLNLNFRKWGHKWVYDWEELERRLKEAGAVNIKRCNLRVSEHPELHMLETRDESTLIAEITK